MPRLTRSASEYSEHRFSRLASLAVDARGALGGGAGRSARGRGRELRAHGRPVAGRPDSVALGDLDGVNGPDIAIAFPALGSVGVMLNNGDGTFAALQQYTAGPAVCAAWRSTSRSAT